MVNVTYSDAKAQLRHQSNYVNKIIDCDIPISLRSNKFTTLAGPATYGD